MKKKRVGVYPGTFDPITYGHIDIVRRASNIIDELIIGVANNIHKNPLLTLDERVELVKKVVAKENLKNVTVDSFDGLLVDYLKKKNINLIIRGLRVVTDFDYEFAYASMNQKMAPDIETIFLMTNEKYSFVSSSLIKEVAKLGGDISGYAPDIVIKKLLEKF